MGRGKQPQQRLAKWRGTLVGTSRPSVEEREREARQGGRWLITCALQKRGGSKARLYRAGLRAGEALKQVDGRGRGQNPGGPGRMRLPWDTKCNLGLGLGAHKRRSG